MKRVWFGALLLAPLLVVGGCGDCGGPGPGPDGGPGDGGDGGCGVGACNSFQTTALTTAPTALIADYTPQLSAALGPNDRVGVAYLMQDAGTGPDGGPDTSWSIHYLEWQGGAVTVQPELVQIVHNPYGVSLAFQPSGQPAIAYLGGPQNLATSTSWWNNDAVISYRNGASSWTEQIAVTRSDEAMGSNGPSNSGYLVGIYPAITFAPNGTAYFAYRDCHNGQSVGTGDYNAADLELAEGGPTAWGHTMLVEGGDDKQAWGGHTKMIMINGQPALVMDKVTGVPSGIGHDVFFLKRDAGTPASWTRPPVLVGTTGDTTSGPSLAHSTGNQIGVAYADRLQQSLYLSESTNGGQSFMPRDVVPQSGSAGWYPSLAYDPATGDPVIAYYVCSAQPGAGQLSNCPQAEDELRVNRRNASGFWYPTTVDLAGGFQPALFFLSNGRMAVVYRDPRSGVVKIAVEQ